LQESVEAAPSETKGGFVRDWLVPVALGLVIGAAAVGAWKFGRAALRSPAWKIVAPLAEIQSPDDEDRAVKELHALGAGARSDLLAVLVDLRPDQIDLKIWVATQLAGEPWFATTSLKEIVRDPNAAKVDRRAVICALVDVQSKEVDTELVLPVLEEWMLDKSDDDRSLAVPRAERMWRDGMLNARWEARIKAGLMEMARRPEGANPDDADRIVGDRMSAVLALQLAVHDEDVRKLLWAAAKDDTDETHVRINAVRALSEGNVLDEANVEDWLAVSKVKDPTVRQTVADNLHRTNSPSFDKVLEPLQFDENSLARAGALDTQIKRRRPTALPRFDELAEDAESFVRYHALFSAGVFKKETEGLPARIGIVLRALETSDDELDVTAAVLALKLIADSDDVPGFQPTDVRVNEGRVEETALATFMADKGGRKQAADEWRKRFPQIVERTDAERRKSLEKLLKHADPKNQEHAKSELATLK
jgi:hypothetical protein